MTAAGPCSGDLGRSGRDARRAARRQARPYSLRLRPKQHLHLLAGVVAEDGQGEEVTGRVLSGVEHRGTVLPRGSIQLFTVARLHQQLVS